VKGLNDACLSRLLIVLPLTTCPLDRTELAILRLIYNSTNLPFLFQSDSVSQLHFTMPFTDLACHCLTCPTPQATPFWWGFRTLLKYRTTKNYTDGAWLGPRIGDKVCCLRVSC
jgi:hypothetical protein